MRINKRMPVNIFGKNLKSSKTYTVWKGLRIVILREKASLRR